MNIVKYGIIGTGSAWEFHRAGCKNNPKIKLTSVYDIDEKRATRVGRSYKMEAFSGENLENFFKSDIDAVIVMVPHFLHEFYVIKAAEAGKHVLCEKPMATTLEGCEEMIKTTRKAGVKFMIAENHRFLPAHKYCMEAVQNGLIGDVFLVRAYEGVNEIPGLMKEGFWKGHPIKAGGGCLMDMGAHKFATLNWILNDKIESACSWLTKQCTTLEEKAEDNALAMIKFGKTKAIGEVVVSFTVSTPPTNSMEIYGTKGTILENHNWEKPVKINSFQKEMGDKRGLWFEPDIQHGAFPKYYEISARIEDNYFTECILEDKKPEFSPEDAKGAIEGVLMCYLSARSGKPETYNELAEVYKTKGTKFILENLQKYVQNNFKKE